MEISSIGRAVLVSREGRRLVAYADSVGVITIGIGCTRIDGKPVPRALRITAAECDALFEATLARYVSAVNRGLAAEVPQHAFDALVSVCYNIGIGTPNPRAGQTPGFLGATFLARLNAGDREGARAAILWWRQPAAIRTRREAEAEQFATPYALRLPRATTASPRLPHAYSPHAHSPSTGLARARPSAPVLAPVSLPPAHPWRDAAVAWIATLLGPSRGHRETPDPAARG